MRTLKSMMKRLFYISTLMLTLASCENHHERPTAIVIPDYDVKKTKEKIIIDGHLNETAWENAGSITLQFPWNQQTGAKQTTNAQLLWDDEYLYVAYECLDKDITALYQQHDDPTYEDDAVELFINPKQNAYIGLEMNARATLYDYLKFDDKLEKSYDLKGTLLATQIDGTLNDSTNQDNGWTLELAIPLRNFFEPTEGKFVIAGTTWTANINRWDGRIPDRRLSMWSDSGLRTPNPHNSQRFGRIHFVH